MTDGGKRSAKQFLTHFHQITAFNDHHRSVKLAKVLVLVGACGMPDDENLHNEALLRLIERERGKIYSEYSEYDDNVRIASDDYRFRDSDNRLLYAVVTHEPWPAGKASTSTVLFTRSMHEALATLDERELNQDETRQIRVGGIAIVSRQPAFRSQEDAEWPEDGQKRQGGSVFRDVGVVAIAAADAAAYPLGGRVSHDEIRLQPIPRMPSYLDPREVHGVLMTRDLEAVLQTAEHSGFWGREIKMLEQLAAAVIIHDGAPDDWSNLEDAWSSSGDPEVLASYASAILDNAPGNRTQDPGHPPKWARGYLDAGERAGVIGDHLLFGTDMLPPGIRPSIRSSLSPPVLDAPRDSTGYPHASPTQVVGVETASPPANMRVALDIQADLKLYDHAHAAVLEAGRLLLEARRLHDRTSHTAAPGTALDAVGAALNAKTVAYQAVNAMTLAPGFWEAARMADTDEGMLMQAAWDDRFDVLAERLMGVRSMAASLQPTSHNLEARILITEMLAKQVESQAAAAKERLKDISEDSYVTRNDLHAQTAFLSTLAKKIRKAGASGTVNLDLQVVDYGYDPEDAAEARYYGEEYVPAIDRKRSYHETQIRRVQGIIDRLQEFGVPVSTRFTAIDPPSEPEMDLEEDHEEWADASPEA